MKEERIVYSTSCTWWDSIDKAGDKGIPCCPFCNSNLFEIKNIEFWNETISLHAEYSGDEQYIKFVNWVRGKCYKTYPMARAEFDKN